MGDLEKMPSRPFKRDFFLFGDEMGLGPEITATPSSLRSDRRQGASPAARRSARSWLRVLDCVLAPALILLWGARAPLFNPTKALDMR